jgi:hypothetical protein
MSRAVPLSRIQELGIRGRDDPAAEPVLWSGMAINAGGLRALHEALHPTLLLLALAGYRADQLVLGPPAGGDILLVTLSPRGAAVTPWADYMGSAGPVWPSQAPRALLIWLEQRPGLTGQTVAVDAAGPLATYVRDVDGWPFLAYDINAAADLGAIADALAALQEPVRAELAARIGSAWAATDWNATTTGLLSALEPDLWTFPDLRDEEDLQRQAFRRLAEPIAEEALTSANGLRDFLLEEAVVRNGDRPPSVRDRLAALAPDEVEDLQRGWNTEAQALWTRRHPDAGNDPFRAADHRRLSYAELVFDMLNESLISLAGYDPAAAVAAYGGYDLQRGDRDPGPNDVQWRYGGADIAGQAPGPTHIADLRADLALLGFGPLADGDADRRTFGPYLESAVREFQIYASLQGVARFGTPEELAQRPAVQEPSLATRLVSQVNDQPYTGPLSGVLNALTRPLVKMWVERDWHCPVVVEARALRAADTNLLRVPDSTIDKRNIVTNRPIDAAHENIWRRDQVPVDLKFIAWDLSGHYPETDGRPNDDPVVVSKWFPPDPAKNSWGGAYALAGECDWSEAEIRPDVVLGAYPDPAERPSQAAFWSTFRVIKAISEVECMGTFDGMNGYDSAILSGGPVHWTLGLGKLANGNSQTRPQNLVIYPGELCPSLAYAADDSPDEYHTFFGAFGIQPREAWANPPVAHYSSGQRKFRGWILLQNEAGDWVDVRRQRPATVVNNEPVPNPEDLALVEVLHHWHWIYRWQMAPRLWQRLRYLMWALARARVRALLRTRWGTTGLTIGDVFTSEASVALLERIHVFNPRWVFGLTDKDVEWRGRTAANINLANLQSGFDEAAKTGGSDPQSWGDTEELALVDWLSPPRPQPVSNVAWGLRDVREWPALVKGIYKHDASMLPIAMEEAPDIGAIAPIGVAPGETHRESFFVTDRETLPEQLEVTAHPAADSRMTADALRVDHVGGNEFELVVTAPDIDEEVPVTVEARDGRQITRREVLVNVNALALPPSGQPADYVRPGPIGLSPLRGSFQLDEADLFPHPPD